MKNWFGIWALLLFALVSLVCAQPDIQPDKPDEAAEKDAVQKMIEDRQNKIFLAEMRVQEARKNLPKNVREGSAEMLPLERAQRELKLQKLLMKAINARITLEKDQQLKKAAEKQAPLEHEPAKPNGVGP